MKCVWLLLLEFFMSSIVITHANASIFSGIAQKFDDIHLGGTKQKPVEINTEPTKINPADKFPDPLFFDAQYPKTLKEISLLYLYNDKSSFENRHIPPVVDLSYIVDNMFTMISNYEKTSDILLMIDAIQSRTDIDISKQDAYGNTLLHYAIRYHNRPIFDKLLSTRLMDPNVCNNSYICPIHLSIYKNDIYEIQNLLTFGADIYFQNDRFEMPIIIAIKMNNREAIKILAKAHKKRGISDSMLDYIIFAVKEQGYPVLAKDLYLFFIFDKEF